ncbi:MAG: DgaE family pyridoxal phosphate-dependent ammonia lyase [Clostridiales bacterium]|nr:DgaE family pyridoxal phosphate-dependent ammonia lyase [Clostridiales bacterium]
MENIYGKNGLQKVINASGRMTKLGVSTISDGVGKTLVEAAGNYVLIDSLFEFAGKKIGEMTGAADACVTSGASAAIALSVASLICGDNLSLVQHLYDRLPYIDKREVIMLKGHNVDFGAPVAEMVQIGGGRIVEVGFANGSKLSDIENAVNKNTLAILFVKSHHCVQKEMVDVKDTIELANRLNIPCIVDAAAEEDLSRYINMGADIVCYSGAKAIEGPTSGFAVCKTSELASNMRLQYKGIGRAMKIGKEGIMGLVQAISENLNGEHTPVVTKEDLVPFVEKINAVPGCKAEIIQDEAGREIYRAKISFNKEEYGFSAREMISKLCEGETAVYTRDYQANLGSLAIDPRPLKSKDELNYIYSRIEEIGKEGK